MRRLRSSRRRASPQQLAASWPRARARLYHACSRSQPHAMRGASSSSSGRWARLRAWPRSCTGRSRNIWRPHMWSAAIQVAPRSGVVDTRCTVARDIARYKHCSPSRESLITSTRSRSALLHPAAGAFRRDYNVSCPSGGGGERSHRRELRGGDAFAAAMTDARYMTELHDIRPGVVLQGRYQVVSELGFGGFGIVYKAIQLATGQPVAVKVMRAVGDEPPERRDNRVARFRREMELCARLQHPHIVGLIDSGQTDDGRLFVAFQIASGKSLDQVLQDEGAMQPREAQHLMAQVLDALSCAHNLGVVHRDLKPANIMITSTGTRRNALVLDFGIGAIAHNLQDPSSAKLTASHERG